MDTKTILGMLATLAVAGIIGVLGIYRDVGVQAQAVVELKAQHIADIEELQDDLKARDARERKISDGLIRVEDKHEALRDIVAALPRCP